MISCSEELVSIMISGIRVYLGEIHLNSPDIISKRLLFGSPKNIGFCFSPELAKLIARGMGLQGDIGL